MKIIPANLISFSASPLKGSNNRFPRLSPLPCDTVSFTGKKTVTINDKMVNDSERSSFKLSNRIYDDSEYAFGQLRFILSETFNTTVVDIDSYNAKAQIQRALGDRKDAPVVMIMARRKTPESISEKMSTLKSRSLKSAKEEMNDIIGARIIVSGNSKAGCDYVLDKLTDAVKKGRIKIKQVKNHGQDDNKTLNYATQKKMNQLVNAARRTGATCDFKDVQRDSGYLGLHILTGEIADGFSAEIQIMGVDVSTFKEIEDLYYKLSAGKSLPKKYAPIEELYKPYKNNAAVKNACMEYTKRAYAYERSKPIHGKEYYHNYLPIPDDLNVPRALDFNNIASMKAAIDNTVSI